MMMTKRDSKPLTTHKKVRFKLSENFFVDNDNTGFSRSAMILSPTTCFSVPTLPLDVSLFKRQSSKMMYAKN